MTENVLVIAFDGLDKDLIEEFNLENIRQEEFGGIDNNTGMSSIKTSELFDSFITGKNYEHHGVKGIRKWTNPNVGKFQDFASKVPILSDKTNELRKAVLESLNSLDAKKRKHRSIDLDADTIFEEISNSRAMLIPSYNPSVFWLSECDVAPLKFGSNREDTVTHYDSREFEHRKRKLFSEIENEIVSPRSFLMCHIHRSDFHQHMYGDRDAVFDKEKLRKLYFELDDFAEQIKRKALDSGYDKIIFMSDHGLPEGESHNLNAFYSCNEQLFVDNKPKITDFYDKVLKLTD